MADEPEELGGQKPAGEPPASDTARSAKTKPRTKPGKKRKRAEKTAPKATALKPTRPFPRVPFVSALKVPQKIKELNGGNPWSPADVATAIGVGRTTGNFYYITAAARDFGLTVGTRDSEHIELTPLGRQIVYAPDAVTERTKKIEAFFKVEVFRKVFEHYGGANLPEMLYLSNTLENQFKVHPEFHQDFVKAFKQNCRDLQLEDAAAAIEALGSDRAGGSNATVTVATPRTTGKQLRAFIIMPMTERRDGRRPGFFDEVLRSLLTPACIQAGFSVETAKKQGSDIIQSTIINDLLDADLVLADLTDHNPNVSFELGMRIREEKPIALIKASDTGPIFDVDNMLRVLPYNPSLWPSTIASDLPLLVEHIKGAWEARTNGQTYMKILRRGISDTARLVG
jgi:hypothetical protein